MIQTNDTTTYIVDGYDGAASELTHVQSTVSYRIEGLGAAYFDEATYIGYLSLRWIAGRSAPGELGLYDSVSYLIAGRSGASSIGLGGFSSHLLCGRTKGDRQAATSYSVYTIDIEAIT